MLSVIFSIFFYVLVLLINTDNSDFDGLISDIDKTSFIGQLFTSNWL